MQVLHLERELIDAELRDVEPDILVILICGLERRRGIALVIRRARVESLAVGVIHVPHLLAQCRVSAGPLIQKLRDAARQDDAYLPAWRTAG